MAPIDPPRRPSPNADATPGADPGMDAYLASLNLEDLDLDGDLALEDAKADGLWVLVGCAVWLGNLGVIAWLPSTLFYQLNPIAEFAYWALWLFAALLTVLLWRGVYTLITAWPFGAELEALKRQRLLARMPPRPLIAPVRLMLLSIVALGALLVLLLPRDVQWQGQGYSGAWFVASLAACATGILVGRFIIAHASMARPARERPVAPIQWPSWMRWATGAAILAGGAVILTLHALTVPGDHSNEFGLAGASLSLGIGAAIWLARRFDELEAKWQKEAQMRQKKQQQQDS
jgi:hypothetical protein